MILLLAGIAVAAPPHEVYLGPGLYVHQSATHLGGGLGGQTGYRWHGEWLTLGGALSYGRFHVQGVFLELEGGLELRPPEVRYQPWFGLELTGTLGTYRIRSQEHPDPSRLPPLALRLAARPLVFDLRSVTLSFLEISWGTPLESVGDGVSLGITPLAVGARW
ncbi:MAG: hypothetical protein H6739_21380 [Alphaproteobacteria bacterium]|nr:hypothetical protein [Alphaproteobacteria bacterium]